MKISQMIVLFLNQWEDGLKYNDHLFYINSLFTLCIDLIRLDNLLT